MSFEDEHNSRRPSDNLAALKGDTIERLVKEVPFVTLEEIAREVHSRVATVWNILYKHFHYRSYISFWIPHTLTPEVKNVGLKFCDDFHTHFQEPTKLFINNIVMCDETRVYHGNPGTGTRRKI
ncbi:hypothetical protein IWQ62_005193 [Dispira parvispora]|uniref:Transposase n=1 Tax=Dispira parvispora TaxID=1520584 RepID=A0A9W8AK75_9FUNG|nr:hypothetical protein IWQ62_005193 [Dispira parvispora]